VAAARNLGRFSTLSRTGLTTHSATDVDYYRFVAARSGTFTLTVRSGSTGGSLGLTVLNTQQSVLANGQSQTGSQTLTVNLVAGRRYYIKVVSPLGDRLTYGLTVARTGATTSGLTKGQVLGHATYLEGSPGADDHDETSAEGGLEQGASYLTARALTAGRLDAEAAEPSAWLNQLYQTLQTADTLPDDEMTGTSRPRSAVAAGGRGRFPAMKKVADREPFGPGLWTDLSV
jgi:hypothetical protein